MPWQPILILSFMTFSALGGLYVALDALWRSRPERRMVSHRVHSRWTDQ